MPIIRFKRELEILDVIARLKEMACTISLLNSGSTAKKHGDPFTHWFDLLFQGAISKEAKKFIKEQGGIINP